MSYHLFLDDERLPHHVKWVRLPIATWSIVRDYKQFVSYVERHGVPSFVTFDHDLCDEHYAVMRQEVESYEHDDGDLKKTFHYGTEKTGYDCAKWLVDYCHDSGLSFPDYAVHSLNPGGKARIESYITSAKESLFI